MRRSSVKTWALIGGGVLTVAVAAIGVVLATSRGGDAGPIRTVNTYVDAANRTDCDALASILTPELNETVSGGCDHPTDYDGNEIDLAFTADETTVDDDTATIHGTMESTDGSFAPDEWEDITFVLVKDDGTWLIDDMLMAGTSAKG